MRSLLASAAVVTMAGLSVVGASSRPADAATRAPAKYDAQFAVDAPSECTKDAITATYEGKPIEVGTVSVKESQKPPVCNVTGLIPLAEIGAARSKFEFTAANKTRTLLSFTTTQMGPAQEAPSHPEPKPIETFGGLDPFGHRPPFSKPTPDEHVPPFSKPTPRSSEEPSKPNSAGTVEFRLFFAATQPSECTTSGLAVTYVGHPVDGATAVLGPRKMYCIITAKGPSEAATAPASSFTVTMNGISKTVLRNVEGTPR